MAIMIATDAATNIEIYIGLGPSSKCFFVKISTSHYPSADAQSDPNIPEHAKARTKLQSSNEVYREHAITLPDVPLTLRCARSTQATGAQTMYELC